MTEHWASRGEEGIRRQEQFEAQQQLQRARKTFWFKLKTGEKGRFTLLDTPDFRFKVHSFTHQGRDYPITCISDMEPCPMCEANIPVSFVLAGTIINHNEYIGKNGNVYKNQKQLLVLKATARKRIEQLIKKNKDLRFTLIEVERGTNQKSLRTGELFEIEKKLTEDKVKLFAPKDVNPTEWVKPFDYEVEFKPITAAEMIKYLGGAGPMPPSGVSIGGAPDDDMLNEEEEEAAEGPKELDDLT